MNKEPLILSAIIVLVLFISFLYSPSFTGKAISAEATGEINTTSIFYSSVILLAMTTVFVLWYYFKRIKELGVMR